MKQWIKCMIGAHEYEILEKQDVKKNSATTFLSDDLFGSCICGL